MLANVESSVLPGSFHGKHAIYKTLHCLFQASIGVHVYLVIAIVNEVGATGGNRKPASSWNQIDDDHIFKQTREFFLLPHHVNEISQERAFVNVVQLLDCDLKRKQRVVVNHCRINVEESCRRLEPNRRWGLSAGPLPPRYFLVTSKSL